MQMVFITTRRAMMTNPDKPETVTALAEEVKRLQAEIDRLKSALDWGEELEEEDASNPA
jgi:hypothetical protein